MIWAHLSLLEGGGSEIQSKFVFFMITFKNFFLDWRGHTSMMVMCTSTGQDGEVTSQMGDWFTGGFWTNSVCDFLCENTKITKRPLRRATDSSKDLRNHCGCASDPVFFSFNLSSVRNSRLQLKYSSTPYFKIQ